jgi:acyl-homoserine lactone acylase PvdQ
MARRIRMLGVAAVLVTVSATTASLALPGSPATAAQPNAAGDYCHGQCNDILPPGENGNATLADILGNKALGTHPPHTQDQLGTYGDLVNSYKGLTNDKLGKFFNDSSFGVPEDQVESTSKPREDVTVVRDKHGIPHITGTTRSGTEYGAGFVAGQDRLWMMDVFRHVGRGELSGFAGGAQANRDLEQTFWHAAPYSEADMQKQIDRMKNSTPRAKQAFEDVENYVRGINDYIDKSHAGRYFPGEYDVTGHVNPVTNQGTIEHFKPTDMVSIAGVIGALFGSGGGGEVTSALVKEAAEAKYGAAKGDAMWRSFREQNDPEADTTVHDAKFPYAGSPAQPKGVAMPDKGSVTEQEIIQDPQGTGKPGSPEAKAATKTPLAADTADKATARQPGKALPRNADGSLNTDAAKGLFDKGVLPGNLLSKKHGMSNALVVSGKHTASGNPVAVFGPQTGYFAPQLLMLEELQGPGISSRGAAFGGLSFYVELGRGADYSWSATSAAQDVTDTYAVDLCNGDGSPATKDSKSYMYHGKCEPMDVLEADDKWSPTLADGTGEGSYKLVNYRTKYGIVQQRATIGGKPVAYTALRSSYMHEADSIIGFQKFNDPNAIKGPEDFQKAAQDINYTFNWFYVDSKHTAYYNSGSNPVRAANTDPNLPIKAEKQFEWQGFSPDTYTADYTPPAEHPNSIDQDFYTSWNNKPAKDYTSPGFGVGSVYRSDLLTERVRALTDSGTKVTRASLTSAMADAAVADLRGERVLPQLLRVIDSEPVTDPAQVEVVNGLRNWLRNGALRKETHAGSHKYTDADTIKTMDAWWPLLVNAEFHPNMGDDLYRSMTTALQINESPSGGQNGPSTGKQSVESAQPHKGSSFQFGWWSYVDKDLRSVLGDKVPGALSQKYCGGGDLAQCRATLLSTLTSAANTSMSDTYPGDADCGKGDQRCADSIIQRPIGGITDDKISWQNRPTFQQVVEYPAHRPS